jgi:ABC-type transporter Mla maintaining outer membrane lipid asymmetry ATPase subunit MlaF
MAKLVEFTGHQDVMVHRYVQETIRDVASQLHAPRELVGAALIAWLKRVGLARGVTIDCEAVLLDAQAATAGRRNASLLVRLARDIHQWKGEIVDGRARHPRDH